MIEIEQIRRWVEHFDPRRDPRARRSRDETLRLFEQEARPLSRSSFAPGHITTSALVLSAERHVLLVFHPRLQRWLQPGGHVEESDVSLLHAARREVHEETGLDLGDAPPTQLVSVDVHAIPACGGEPAHRHHDLMFCFDAAGSVATPTNATLRTAWCAPDRLEEFAVDLPLRHAVGRALGRTDLMR